MNGLDNIIAKIKLDCEVECEGILGKANDAAKEILDKAEIESSAIAQSITSSALQENENEIELLNSRVVLERKKNLLALKIEIVNGIVESALSKIRKLSDDEYFNTIKSLILKYAQSGSATLRFSKRDLDRLPEGFEADVSRELQNGASVKISSQPVQIDGGFLLVYDDVDQNCSFEALLASSVDEIKDKLFTMLFKRTDL